MYNRLSFYNINRLTKTTGLSESTIRRLFFKARIVGKDPEDFPVKEETYLKSKESRGIYVKVYAGYCFIITEDGMCITAYKLPNWFGRKNFYVSKERLRNPKQYYKDLLPDIDDYELCG